MTIEHSGAVCFGMVIGWLTYFTMRYKKEHAITDIASVIGAVGGAAVLSLFSKESAVFSWYSVGLAIGFFGYVILLLILCGLNKQLSVADLLDGSKAKNPFMGG
jgi:uncharacterized membrane protein YeaQ/YmgE (transglycosylase-associated protein family)